MTEYFRQHIILLKSFGAADIQNSFPVTDKSVFAINSCAKAFTGVAIIQLVEEGKIDLSAPVSRYLGGLPAAWQPVTIRQLLTHVSGLPNLLQVLDPITNGFGTGERFSYNQTNYDLLFFNSNFMPSAIKKSCLSVCWSKTNSICRSLPSS